ncbi:hypothetical protein HWN39_11555 [Lactobacillus rhamnosus]|uniref:Uncharacterized protein n=1 Tax=Lacticaseibacillus rhamnosus TaxID=47715 RepID=A0A7Y7QH56_LACRH|nr:hypothetical protein [Lacticaseibacillus rhamnosus]NVO89107.1 hypothetical protein [Lacticaseibacillus rhamnosus]
MLKRRSFVISIAGLTILLVVVFGIVLIRKNNLERRLSFESSRSLSVSASKVKVSKWQVSVSVKQSAANSKFHANKALKDSVASSALASSEAKSKAEADNTVDFDKLSKTDQAKAAIYYGLGNMQYFNDKSVSNYPGEAAYSSDGVDVIFVKGMSAGIDSTPYLVTPHNSQVSVAAPVYSYVDLGMQADGHRPEGLTYGKVGGDSKNYIPDPALHNTVGISYTTINNWINSHGGMSAIRKIRIAHFIDSDQK